MTERDACPERAGSARVSRRRLLAVVPGLVAAGVPAGSAAQDAAAAWLVQFVHPQKIIGFLPGLDEARLAGLYGLDAATYRAIASRFAANAGQAAAQLLADPAFAAQVDRLPFAPGSTIVAVGDSTTDDLQSWFEILRHLLDRRRPADRIDLVNEGVSGRTTTEALKTFGPVVARQPDWIVCFLGANDAVGYGLPGAKSVVSREETVRNLAEMRSLAAALTTARWVWIVMYPIGVAPAPALQALPQPRLTVRNEDIPAVGEVLRGQPEPAVDLVPLFGNPPAPELLLADGVHPSLAGHTAIAQAFVERLSATYFRPRHSQSGA